MPNQKEPFPAVGRRVRCVQTADGNMPVRHIGKTGTVTDNDSILRRLVRVEMDDSAVHYFWPEELEGIDV